MKFRLDNSVVCDDTLYAKFSRAAASCSPRGGYLGPHQMRWDTNKLAVSAPVTSIVAGTTTEAHDLMGVGVDYDGITPVYVVKKVGNGTNSVLQVYLNDLSSTPYEYAIHVNASKDNALDALRDSADNQAAEAWNPKVACVAWGVVVILCLVKKNYSGTWRHNKIGFMTCKTTDLRSGAKSTWWKRHALSDVLPGLTAIPSTANSETVTTWAMQTYWVLDRTNTAPTKIWFAGTDYQSGQAGVGGGKFGGVYWLFPMTRSTGYSSDWTLDSVMELPGRFSRSTNSTHSHNLGIVRTGTTGIRAMGTRGDSSGNNCQYVWDLADEANYRASASLPNNGSETAVNYYSGGTNWTGPTVVSGMVDDAASATQDDSVTEGRVFRRNSFQDVAIAPGPFPGTLLKGSDEEYIALNLVSVEAQTIDARFRMLYDASQVRTIPGKVSADSTGLNRNCLLFNMRTPEPENPNTEIVAQLGPSEFDYIQQPKYRALYSPDGLHWASYWSHREYGQVPIHFDRVNRRLYSGSQGTSGIRWVSAPTSAVVNGLRINPGAKNYLKSQVSGDVTIRTATPTVTFQPVLPSGAPNPPVIGNNVWKVAYNCGVTGGDLLVWKITPDNASADTIPNDTDWINVKFWVLVEPSWPLTDPTVGSSVAAATFRVRFRFGSPAAGNGLTGYSRNIKVTPNDGASWVPVMISVRAKGLHTVATVSLLTEMFLEAAGGSADVTHPFYAYFALESVTTSDTPVYPCAPGTNADNELFTLSGFSASQFTAIVHGQTPSDGQWDMQGVGSLYDTGFVAVNSTTTTLTGGSSTDNFYVGHRLFGATVIANSDTGLLISAYNGTTKAATHEAHAGSTGSFTGDVVLPSNKFDSANPGLKPLWSMCNSTATTGFTVFADTGTGSVCIATWNGSAYGALSKITGLQWMPGSNVLTSVKYDGTNLKLTASCCGNDISSVSLAASFSANLTELRFASLNASPTVTAMTWFGGRIETKSLDDSDIWTDLTTIPWLVEPVRNGRSVFTSPARARMGGGFYANRFSGRR